MPSTIRFYGGNYTDHTFLKLYQTTILKADDYSCVFTENTPTQLRMYYLSHVTDTSLLLVTKDECGQIERNKFNAEYENDYAIKQAMGLKLAQVVVTDYTQPTNIVDRDKVIMDIRQYTIEKIKNAGATSATCRYYADLVEGAFLGSTGPEGIYSIDGFVIADRSFVSSWKTVLLQLKKLMDLDIITYQTFNKGEAVLKFNKIFLNYNQLIAPKFFDSFTF